MVGGTGVDAALTDLTDNVTQRDIVAFVANRGYLEGYTLDQRIARQLVKQLEETCEALQSVRTFNDTLDLFLADACRLGRYARAIFDVPSLFDSVGVDVPTLIEELPDMVVPLAVLADALGVPDMMAAGLEKAEADVKRGVRNGSTAQNTPAG